MRYILITLAVITVLALYLITYNPDTHQEITGTVTLSENDIREVEVFGNSMLPTLTDGQKVSVFFNYYDSRPIERGDLVAVDLNDRIYVKRVIGLHGDTMYFSNNKIILNNEILAEPYIRGAQITEQKIRYIKQQLGNRPIPEDYVLILSDNREDQSDSVLGKIDVKAIAGKVMNF